MWECRMIYAGSVDAETKLNLFKGSRAQRKNRKQPRIVFNEIIGFHLKRLDTASSKQRGDPKRLQRREWRGRGSVAADVQFAQILESLETVRKPSWNLCEVGVVEDQMEVEDVLSKMGGCKMEEVEPRGHRPISPGVHKDRPEDVMSTNAVSRSTYPGTSRPSAGYASVPVGLGEEFDDMMYQLNGELLHAWCVCCVLI
ncbi:hypothetical protein BDN71DRAFT_817845 [Pleurotus eryngii]|uniref:Uncharacterized protein n=1 Tax=Pleurotus eryngii TaxID=5323 RepID=A0A9P6DH07_PLEER|nr:hypothetical protein BDN71DRAFT_817845 [Pleurotus eryngii]